MAVTVARRVNEDRQAVLCLADPYTATELTERASSSGRMKLAEGSKRTQGQTGRGTQRGRQRQTVTLGSLSKVAIARP